MRKVLRRLILRYFGLKIYIFKRILSRNKASGDYILVCPCLFMGAGKIRAGKGMQFGYHPSPYFYSGYTYVEARACDAVIDIGDNTVINNRAVLISDGAGIYIGRNCLIGMSCEIYDTDFHTVDPSLRHKETPKPCKVVIGDNVFIGSGVKILKGVSLGHNCVVGAGSVVTASFPDNVMVAGNPAVKIRDL